MAAGRWRLNLCGINHKTASVAEREPLGFGQEDYAEAHAEFAALDQVLEATIVSTCNRTEFYFIAPRTSDPFDIVFDYYDRLRGINIWPLHDKFYVHYNRQAAKHLFRVAGGLDSMVLGENQILGQIKDAYSSACAVKASGKVIHRLFHQAFRMGKQVRSETEMGKGCCSVSNAAMELLRTRLGKFEQPTVLFIGVNQMIDLATANLSREQHGPFLFANRTVEKAAKLARRYDGEGHGLDQLADLMAQSDIVITCTGAREPVISRDMIHAAVAENKERPLVIMDMALPRDVDYTANGHAGVEVYDLEAVQHHVAESQERRKAAVPEAEQMIERRLGEFMYWYDHVRREPVDVPIEDAFEEARKIRMASVLSQLPPTLRNDVDRATRDLMQTVIQMTAKTCSKCSKSE